MPRSRGRSAKLNGLDEAKVECPELLGVAAPVADTFFVQPLLRSEIGRRADDADQSYALDLGPLDDDSFARFEDTENQQGWSIEVEISVRTP